MFVQIDNLFQTPRFCVFREHYSGTKCYCDNNNNNNNNNNDNNNNNNNYKRLFLNAHTTKFHFNGSVFLPYMVIDHDR